MSAERLEPEVVRLRIDGRSVRARAGSYLLEAAREAGFEIPTLCHHPALEPVGACRLCMVEVTHPDWRGWSGLMTACLYPVSDGIEIQTDSERVRTSRRRTLALLRARCPDVPAIAELAARYGATSEGLHSEADADRCIVCGLCTRVCESFATSAIATRGRGSTKAVGAFGEGPPEECVGCGACALICPTGHIVHERSAQGYTIWQRTFPTAVCKVDPARCVGCGACEQSCPFDVPRVGLRLDGAPVASIAEPHCRGCGACVDACPNGAIDQQGYDGVALGKADPAHARGAHVFACTRAGLGRAELADAAALSELPCVGRVSTALLLARLAQGARGVLVLGRHQQSCRLQGGEDWAERRARRADRIAQLVGLGADRARFCVAPAGPSGPVEAVRAYLGTLEEIGPSPLAEPAPAVLCARDGLDGELELVSWLSEHAQAEPPAAARRHEIVGWGSWAAELPARPLLYAGTIPYLDILGSELWRPIRLPDALRQASALLARLLGAEPSVGISGCGAVRPADAARWQKAPAIYALGPEERRALRAAGLDATLLDELLQTRAGELARPPVRAAVACDGTAEAMALLGALGYRAVDAGPDPLPDRFCFSPAERQLADERLSQAARKGARALLVSGPSALARHALLCRHGSWRSSRILPLLGAQLAALSCAQLPLGTRSLGRAHYGLYAPVEVAP